MTNTHIHKKIGGPFLLSDHHLLILTGTRTQLSPPQRNLDQRARIDVDVDALEHVAVLPKQKDAIMFIRALQRASLDDPCAKLNDAALQRLRHPLQEPLHIEEPAIRHGIISYFALEHSTNKAYERIRNSAARNFEGAAEIPSHARIERLIAEYTGIESIEHDMCPDTCVAFTGPFAELMNCPICGTERYDPIKLRASGGRTCVARQKFKYHNAVIICSEYLDRVGICA